MLSSPFHRWGTERQRSTLCPNSKVSWPPHSAHIHFRSFQIPQVEDVLPFRIASCQPQGWTLCKESLGKAQGKAKDDMEHGDLSASGQFQYWPPGVAPAFLVPHLSPAFLPPFFGLLLLLGHLLVTASTSRVIKAIVIVMKSLNS